MAKAKSNPATNPAAPTTLDPKTLLQNLFEEGGGLRDNYDGTILKSRWVAWSYPDGSAHGLGLAWWIRDDDNPDEAIRPEVYGAGKLEFFLPSMDGVAPLPSDVTDFDWRQLDDPAAGEGYFYVAAEGNTSWTRLSKSCKVHELLQKSFAGGFPVEHFAQFYDSETGRFDARAFEGARAHFDRVPQDSGKDRATGENLDSQGRVRRILVITNFHEIVDVSGETIITEDSTGDAAEEATSESTAAATVDASDVESELETLILEKLGEVDPLPFGKALTAATTLSDQASKAAAVKLVRNAGWLGSEDRPWTYDAKAKTLTLGG